MTRKTAIGAILGLSFFAAAAAQPASAAGLTVGYSDWPGWVAWQVAIDKGWLKEAGLDVTFQ
jgi:NitT/TauT family transport system substrate-binding protein